MEDSPDMQVETIIREPLGAADISEIEHIELMFFAYRAFTADADRMLERLGFGRAHHRALYFINRKPGMTVAELPTYWRSQSRAWRAFSSNCSTPATLPR